MKLTDMPKIINVSALFSNCSLNAIGAMLLANRDITSERKIIDELLSIDQYHDSFCGLFSDQAEFDEFWAKVRSHKAARYTGAPEEGEAFEQHIMMGLLLRHKVKFLLLSNPEIQQQTQERFVAMVHNLKEQIQNSGLPKEDIFDAIKADVDGVMLEAVEGYLMPQDLNSLTDEALHSYWQETGYLAYANNIGALKRELSFKDIEPLCQWLQLPLQVCFYQEDKEGKQGSLRYENSLPEVEGGFPQLTLLLKGQHYYAALPSDNTYVDALQDDLVVYGKEIERIGRVETVLPVKQLLADNQKLIFLSATLSAADCEIPPEQILLSKLQGLKDKMGMARAPHSVLLTSPFTLGAEGLQPLAAHQVVDGEWQAFLDQGGEQLLDELTATLKDPSSSQVQSFIQNIYVLKSGAVSVDEVYSTAPTLRSFYNFMQQQRHAEDGELHSQNMTVNRSAMLARQLHQYLLQTFAPSERDRLRMLHVLNTFSQDNQIGLNSFDFMVFYYALYKTDGSQKQAILNSIAQLIKQNEEMKVKSGAFTDKNKRQAPSTDTSEHVYVSMFEQVDALYDILLDYDYPVESMELPHLQLFKAEVGHMYEAEKDILERMQLSLEQISAGLASRIQEIFQVEPTIGLVIENGQFIPYLLERLHTAAGHLESTTIFAYIDSLKDIASPEAKVLSLTAMYALLNAQNPYQFEQAYQNMQRLAKSLMSEPDSDLQLTGGILALFVTVVGVAISAAVSAATFGIAAAAFGCVIAGIAWYMGSSKDTDASLLVRQTASFIHDNYSAATVLHQLLPGVSWHQLEAADNSVTFVADFKDLAELASFVQHYQLADMFQNSGMSLTYDSVPDADECMQLTITGATLERLNAVYKAQYVKPVDIKTLPLSVEKPAEEVTVEHPASSPSI